MMESVLRNHREVNQASVGDFKIKGRVKTYSQLHDYDDFRGFDLPNDNDIPAISQRIYEWFANPSRITLKRHLHCMRIPKTLFKAVREIPLVDKKDEFTQAMLCRIVAKIHISKTPNGLAGMDFIDYGDGGDSLRPKAILRDITRLLALVGKEKKDKAADKVGGGVNKLG